MDATGPPDGERLDALRRRLYAPGATEADITAYRTAIEQDEEPTDQPIADVARPAVRRRRAVAWAAVAAAAVLVVAALGVTAVAQLRPLAGETERPDATTATTGAPEAEAEAEGTIPTSAAVRLAFVRALRSGRTPGLLNYVFEHPEYRPSTLRTTGAAASNEYSGQATHTIALDPPSSTANGGWMTVIVLLDSDTPFSWQAERIDQRDDRSGPVVPVGSHRGSARAGVPISATIPYTGAAPTRLAVFVDESVRWDVVVVFPD